MTCRVGAPGFEPGTSCSQSRRATRLRHAPPRAGDSADGTKVAAQAATRLRGAGPRNALRPRSRLRDGSVRRFHGQVGGPFNVVLSRERDVQRRCGDDQRKGGQGPCDRGQQMHLRGEDSRGQNLDQATDTPDGWLHGRPAKRAGRAGVRLSARRPEHGTHGPGERAGPWQRPMLRRRYSRARARETTGRIRNRLRRGVRRAGNRGPCRSL
jgi:hypothetical protein